MKKSMLALAISLVVFLVPLASTAQNPSIDGGAEADDCRLVDGVLDCGHETVVVEIEAPDAIYILRPTSLTFEHQRLQTSFLPELLRTVTEEPL